MFDRVAKKDAENLVRLRLESVADFIGIRIQLPMPIFYEIGGLKYADVGVTTLISWWERKNQRLIYNNFFMRDGGNNFY